MKRVLSVLLFSIAPLMAQDYKIAIVGLVHSHVSGHLHTVLRGGPAKLVGIAESNPDLVAEAKKMGAADSLFFNDYKKMLDQVKPDIVWAFVENNRHLEIVQACAPRKINVIFEKPLASSYKDALAIRSLAQRSGILVMTNYQMVWWPANYAAKAAADHGEIGRVWRLHGIVGHGGPGSDGPRNKYFFAWLTDPVKNGAGALMDFGCYNALWSLWYRGKPETVYAEVNHLRPERFPKVEDNSTMTLAYKDGVGIFEGSWDLPRSFQDLEVYGLGGSLYMQRGKVEERKGKEAAKELALAALPSDRAEPAAYMVSRMREHKPLDGLVATDINVSVIQIIDAAKESVKTGRAMALK